MMQPMTLLNGRASARRQRGVVMFIALIVMVALSLAAVALVRSVDTTNAVIGNLSFRMASVLPGNLAVESAAAALFPDADIANVAHIPDKTNDLPAENYFASWQNTDDRRGVPLVLQKKSTAQALAKTLHDPTTQTDMAYVIERMCGYAGPPLSNLPTDPVTPGSSCDLLLSKQPLGTTLGDPQIKLPAAPYYRVTIRVDGPQNTASFLQAMLQ
jgi:type IV pilus assembly protein PilX